MEHLLRATAKAEARHFWFRGFRAFVTPLIQSATRGRSSALILDCGCGTGGNLDLLVRYGRAFGFDLSEVGLRIARTADRPVARASVASVPFRSATFNLVTSFDVLYALDDADETAAVAEMFRLLKPGGFVLVNVAAMDVLRGDHSALSLERRRYTARSLRTVIERAGFSVARLTYTNATLFLPLALVRTFHRCRGLSAEAEATQEITVPPAPVNLALTALLGLESLWLRLIDNPFGSSLLCLARKPDGAGGLR